MMANREKVIRECNWAIDQILCNGFTTLMTKGFFRDVITLLKADQNVLEELKDAKVVVRCKDCKHRSDKMYDYYGNPNDKVYVCQINDLAKKPDWFCADGEQKEVK